MGFVTTYTKMPILLFTSQWETIPMWITAHIQIVPLDVTTLDRVFGDTMDATTFTAIGHQGSFNIL